MDTNPFVYSRPLSPEDIIDREEETHELLKNALGGHYVRLYAPRKYGKTSLLRKALLDGERQEGLVPVLVDFYGIVSLADVVVRIERAYSRELKGAVRGRVEEFLQRTGLGLSLGAFGISAKLQLEPRTDPLPALHALLDLPLRLEESGGFRAFIALDEFQDVAKVQSLDAILRSRIQFHGDVASYVFAGSEPLVARASEWLPLTAWSVLAVEADGVIRWLGSRDVDPMLKGPAEAIAETVTRSGQAALRVTSYVADPISGDEMQARQVETSLLGWPLVAERHVVGVLIGVRLRSGEPAADAAARLTDAMVRLSSRPPLRCNARLRVARAEALSVTDDLTQLYNSRYLNDALRKETKRAMRSGWPLRSVHRSGRIQAHQRRARPPAGQPGAHRGRRRHPHQRAGNRHRCPVRRRRIRDSSPRDRPRRRPVGRPAGARSDQRMCFCRSRLGQPAHRIYRRRHPPRRRRYRRRSPAGGRRRDVSREGRRQERHSHGGQRGDARRVPRGT